MNLGRELECARTLAERHFGYSFTSQELWRMVTVDAARALGFRGTLGELVAGAAGDVAVFRRGAADPFESVVRARPLSPSVEIRAAKLLRGSSRKCKGLRRV